MSYEINPYDTGGIKTHLGAAEVRAAENRARRDRDIGEFDKNRVLPWIPPTQEVAAEQSKLWQKQDDFKVVGAILSECETAMRQIGAGTWRNRMNGEHEKLCAEAADVARKAEAVLASLRKAAFTEAELFDQKAKALRSKA